MNLLIHPFEYNLIKRLFQANYLKKKKRKKGRVHMCDAYFTTAWTVPRSTKVSETVKLNYNAIVFQVQCSGDY